MGALTVVEFVTLDGVVQGFHGADERDGFRHSGWGERYQDPAQFDAAVEHLPGDGCLPVRSPDLRRAVAVLAVPARREPDGRAPQPHAEARRDPSRRRAPVAECSSSGG